MSVNKKRNIQLRDFGGNVIQEIKLDRNIRDYSMSADSTYIFVLAENSLIYVYNVNTGDKEGYIPPFSKYPVTHFGFNKDESRLIVAHSDGSIYYLKSEEVILEPNAKAPRLGAGAMGPAGTGTGYGGNSGGGNLLGSEGEKRDDHSLDFRAAYNLLPDSNYTHGFSASIGYSNAMLPIPVYIGAMITPTVCLPNSDFPYEYYSSDDEPVSPPMFIKLNISLPIGIYFKPFGDDWEFFAEIQPAFSVHALYSQYFFSGSLFYSGSAAVYLGASFKRIAIYAGGIYDFGYGFSFSAGIGYRLRLGKKTVEEE